jgi:hypothetical protein
MANNLMLQSALSRLAFWEAELIAATEAGNVDKVCECARFIEEYGLLIKQITCEQSAPDEPPPAKPDA